MQMTTMPWVYDPFFSFSTYHLPAGKTAMHGVSKGAEDDINFRDHHQGPSQLPKLADHGRAYSKAQQGKVTLGVRRALVDLMAQPVV